MADKYTSDNLYVDEIINFEYVVNPDKDDDLDLYEYAFKACILDVHSVREMLFV